MSQAIETYVTSYQASPFATYGTEVASSGDSKARGRGEAAALAKLGEWEQGGLLATVSESELLPRLIALVDVPQLTNNRQRVNVASLLVRWSDEMATAFPSLAKRKPLLEHALNRAAEQTERARDLDRMLGEPRLTRGQRQKRERDPEGGEGGKDQEGEEETSAPMMTGMPVASPSVLAERRIVKVRRSK